MTDNIAVLAGYTEEVFIEYKGMTINVLAMPNQDLSQRFKAWDMNQQEFIFINGWLCDSINYC
jgi:hypothetical protein